MYMLQNIHVNVHDTNIQINVHDTNMQVNVHATNIHVNVHATNIHVHVHDTLIIALYLTELDLRQRRGSVSPEVLLLTVADPEERLGSGGATLNALLVAAEHLSARAGFMVSPAL